MKTLISIVLLLFIFTSTTVLTSCDEEVTDTTSYYIKEKFILKDKDDKVGKYFLIQRVKDTNEYAEINQESGLSDSIYYNREEKDTLFFKYIRKDRFFHIKGKLKIDTSTKVTNIRFK